MLTMMSLHCLQCALCQCSAIKTPSKSALWTVVVVLQGRAGCASGVPATHIMACRLLTLLIRRAWRLCTCSPEPEDPEEAAPAEPLPPPLDAAEVEALEDPELSPSLPSLRSSPRSPSSAQHAAQLMYRHASRRARAGWRSGHGRSSDRLFVSRRCLVAMLWCAWQPAGLLAASRQTAQRAACSMQHMTDGVVCDCSPGHRACRTGQELTVVVGSAGGCGCGSCRVTSSRRC